MTVRIVRVIAVLAGALLATGCGKEAALRERATILVSHRYEVCERHVLWLLDHWPNIPSLGSTNEITLELLRLDGAAGPRAQASKELIREAVAAISGQKGEARDLILSAYSSAEAICALAENPEGMSKLGFMEQFGSLKTQFEGARSRVALLVTIDPGVKETILAPVLDAERQAVEEFSSRVEKRLDEVRERQQQESAAREEQRRREAEEAEAARVAAARAEADAAERRAAAVAQLQGQRERERERLAAERAAYRRSVAPKVRAWSAAHGDAVQQFARHAEGLSRRLARTPPQDYPAADCRAVLEASGSARKIGVTSSGVPEIDRLVSEILVAGEEMARACQARSTMVSGGLRAAQIAGQLRRELDAFSSP